VEYHGSISVSKQVISHPFLFVFIYMAILMEYEVTESWKGNVCCAVPPYFSLIYLIYQSAKNDAAKGLSTSQSQTPSAFLRII
jgi:hypothetical protein